MRTCRAFRGLVFLGVLGAASPVLAFDTNAGTVTPAAAFQAGYAAYQNGDLQTAVDAINYAAEQGYTPAQWMLGQLYARGEGVGKDDRRAFEIFAGIADRHANDNPNGADAPFVADALVTLGDYYREGGVAVPNDRERARQLYLHAATVFADAEAQYNLATMFYAGELGTPDPTRAVGWARLAAENGSPSAQALLGHMLFEGEGVQRQSVLGLTYLTIAFLRSAGDDAEIRRMHEHAFSVATEAERRNALALAQDWLAANTTLADRRRSR